MFKVGDKIRVSQNAKKTDQKYLGQTGEIIEILEGLLYPYKVRFDNFRLNKDIYKESDLEAIEYSELSPPSPKFKVGDIVKILVAPEDIYVGKTGTVVLVDLNLPFPYEVKVPLIAETGVFVASELALVDGRSAESTPKEPLQEILVELKTLNTILESGFADIANRLGRLDKYNQ